MAKRRRNGKGGIAGWVWRNTRRAVVSSFRTAPRRRVRSYRAPVYRPIYRAAPADLNENEGDYRSRVAKGNDFEKEVASLLRRVERYQTQIVGGAGDGGIDIWLYRAGRPVGVVQCKYFSNPSNSVAPNDIRSIGGVRLVKGLETAIVVTTGGFTPQGIKTAKEFGVRLIGGKELVALQHEARIAEATSSSRGRQSSTADRLEQRARSVGATAPQGASELNTLQSLNRNQVTGILGFIGLGSCFVLWLIIGAIPDDGTERSSTAVRRTATITSADANGTVENQMTASDEPSAIITVPTATLQPVTQEVIRIAAPTNTSVPDSTNTQKATNASAPTSTETPPPSATQTLTSTALPSPTATGVPATATPTLPQGVLRASSNINIRNQPGTDSVVVYSVPAGTSVGILREREVDGELWLFVRVDNAREGWVIAAVVQRRS